VPPVAEVKGIARLNKLCFGDDDIYNDPRRVAGCTLYTISSQRQVVAYALVKPGRVASLERYGVRPGWLGKGYALQVLQKALKDYKAVWTYASGSNGASCAAMLKVGFMMAGAGEGWVYFLYLAPESMNS
jgi:hypothetical protein